MPAGATSAPCPRCAALEDELAYLRSELALSDLNTKAAILRRRHGLTRLQARLVLALYATRRRVLGVDQLLDAVAAGPRERGLIRTAVSQVRTRLGPGFIENVRGLGYRLSAEASATVATLLAEPLHDAAGAAAALAATIQTLETRLAEIARLATDTAHPVPPR